MKPIQQLTDDELLQRIRDAAALPDAPPGLINKAIALMPAAARPATLLDTARAALHSAIAALTFDSWSGGTLAHGVRGVPSDVRHLLYSALGRDVDVRVSPVAGRYVLAGQVLGPDESGTIELTRVSGTPLPDDDGFNPLSELDAMGQFRIEGIPVGEYVLRFRLGDDEIALPAIDLGARRA